ncbi:MAG: glycosyltransferase family 1 protein [Candidatus Omnitrophota bacterium]
MRVLLNALSITNRSGTGRYAWGLIHGFVQNRFADLDLHVLVPSDFLPPERWRNAEGVNFISIPIRSAGQRFFWEQWRLPNLVNHIQPDVLHSPAFLAPFLRKINAAQIVTIHDMAFRTYRQTIPLWRRLFYSWAIPASMRRASIVITDSRAIAQELSTSPRPLPRLRVIPIHLGVDRETFHPNPQPQDAAVARSYGLESPYILAVGTMEPRKNLSMLAEAHSLAQNSGLKAELVLAGRYGWMVDAERFRRPGVRLIGYVPDDSLPALYRCAVALAAPSWYEGFDLPAQEALACGTSVIASDIPVHRETMNDGVLFAPPNDREAWAKGLCAVEKTSKPTRLSPIRGWDETARETRKVYEDAMA